MKKIFYGLFFAIIVSLPIRPAFPQGEPEFVPAENAIWFEEISDDETVTEFTKGDECYVLIRQPNPNYKDGVAIRTTEKPTKAWGGVKKNPAIQWNFFSKNVLRKEKYSFSLWGKNYTEDAGPEISARCKKYLPELFPSTQKILREYGAME